MTDLTQPNPNREVESVATGGTEMETHGFVGFSHCFKCAKSAYRELEAYSDGLKRTLEESQRERMKLAVSNARMIGEAVELRKEIEALKVGRNEELAECQSELSALKGENERLMRVLEAHL